MIFQTGLFFPWEVALPFLITHFHSIHRILVNKILFVFTSSQNSNLEQSGQNDSEVYLEEKIDKNSQEVFFKKEDLPSMYNAWCQSIYLL